MGKRGPKRTPPALRVVSNSSVGEEPPPPPIDDDRPTPPAWLTTLARREWDRIEQSLWATGCLTEIDQGMFAAYCMAWGRYEQAEIDLNAWIAAEATAAKKPSRKKKAPRTSGAMLQTTAGNKIMNPLFGIVNTLRRDMQRLASEFGLSPAARASVGGSGKGKGRDAIADKFFGGG
jgi:P27 family predicted phage terminase small subunit